MKTGLSVVVPAYNEAEHLPETIDALATAARRARLNVELLLVDDGSNDGTAQAAHSAAEGKLPISVIGNAHEGRYVARRTGVKAARYDHVLLLDARVRLHGDSLLYVSERLSDAPVWNGHVVVETGRNPFGAFADVLVRIAWARYFDQPRATSFGLDDFDYFPKGTGCFIAPKALLLNAMESFVPRISNLRLLSDDTQLIRSIAAQERIHIAPEFGCDYQPRTSLTAFIRNAVYRGSTFFDGHARRESRFFPVAVAFFPVSAAFGVVGLRRPMTIPVFALATASLGAIFARRARPSIFEAMSFAGLMPVYAAAHGVGMWRGLALFARARGT